MVQPLMSLCDKVGDLVLVEFLVTFFDTIGFLLSKSSCTSDLRVEFRMAICAIVWILHKLHRVAWACNWLQSLANAIILVTPVESSLILSLLRHQVLSKIAHHLMPAFHSLPTRRHWPNLLPRLHQKPRRQYLLLFIFTTEFSLLI